MAFEQSRDFTKRRVRRGGDDVTSHNVGNLLCIRLNVVVCERRPPPERLEPPCPASLRSRFRPPHQVAFAHDPDQLTALSDNGDRTNPAGEQCLGNLNNAGIRSYGDDVGGHDISGSHLSLFFPNLGPDRLMPPGPLGRGNGQIATHTG